MLDDKWVTSCIALGSNMGDRAHHLDQAVDFLGNKLSADHWYVESPRIETAPVDCPPGSEPFLNSVLLIHNHVTIGWAIAQSRILLAILKSLEINLGRNPEHERNAPRPIDLDLIFYGDTIVTPDEYHPELTLPHPRAHLRQFVLEPLSHLLPDHVLPGQHKTVVQLLAGLKGRNASQGQSGLGNSPSSSPT